MILLKYGSISKNKIRVIYNGVSNDYDPLNYHVAYTNKVIFVGSVLLSKKSRHCSIIICRNVIVG